MSGWNILYGLINFAILAGGLYLVGKKIVLNMFRKHRDEVSQGLENSERAAKNAETLLAELPQREAQGREALEQIGQESEKAVRKALEGAEAQTKATLAGLAKDAAGEEARFRRSLRRKMNAEAAEEICAKAAELVQKPENAAARKALDARFVQRMEREVQLTDGDRMRLMAGEGLRVSLSAVEQPEKALLQRLNAALEKAGIEDPQTEVFLNETLIGGMVLQIGDTVYDGSLTGLLARAEKQIAAADDDGDDALAALRIALEKVNGRPDVYQTGRVISVSDGICRVSGVSDAMAGELLELDGGMRGMVMDLEKDNVGVVLLGSYDSLQEGAPVRRTGRILSVPVGEELIGRVVDSLGRPIDGAGEIRCEETRPIESPAPGVIARKSVSVPMQTGIKAIDALIPIGRGQRELIIGDRQTGKTAVAIDTIINQRDNFLKGDPVYCIYVAVGQKGSTVASIVKTLRDHGAMDYTIVVAATAADPAALQYYAPFAGAAIGEYFRDTGRHALVVYDDLSKQAVAYREVSLILRRPSGREAYPGDIFYLHSRLLERAAKIIGQQEVAEQMNDLPEALKGKVRGGGSLTALPIIETQAGDVSAYIPTNVISITDGQIYLESGLFNQGIRPAINVGISVSRVGGSAQVKSMKKVAGTLKIDQAQYAELEAFSKFSSDMDKVTAMALDKGRKNNQLLIQPQYSPMPVGEQIAVLYCGTNALMRDIPVDRVREFQDLFLDRIRALHKEDVLAPLAAGKMTDEIGDIIRVEATSIIAGML